tara:strand:+ start:548 stop:904 length:357 start_codon:yes stop_codon:yes gene_type:complete
MKIIINIQVYHSTDSSNVKSIIKNGFDPNTISCATQDINWARGYGDTLLKFTYPYSLYFSFSNFKEDKEYALRFITDYFSKTIPVALNGFKPKNIRIMKKDTDYNDIVSWDKQEITCG